MMEEKKKIVDVLAFNLREVLVKEMYDKRTCDLFDSVVDYVNNYSDKANHKYISFEMEEKFKINSDDSTGSI